MGTARGVLVCLLKRGLAERRTHKETITLVDEHEVYYDKNGNRVPFKIPVYDKEGNYVDNIRNPKIDYAGWAEEPRTFEVEIAEYKISLAD